MFETLKVQHCRALQARTVVLVGIVAFMLLPYITLTRCSKGSCNQVSVVYAILTGPSWETIGQQGAATWYQNVTRPDRVVLASNHKLNVQYEVYFQIGIDEYVDAGRRFLDVLLNLPIRRNEWLFIADDDTFIIVHNALRIVKQVDTCTNCIYAELACEPICGGGGVLINPNTIKLLRQRKHDILSFNLERGYRSGDHTLSHFILEHMQDSIRLEDLQGHFNSQPPNFYKKYPYKSALSVERLRVSPVTFHYVDEFHQKRYNDTYKCGKCESLIPALYHQHYLCDEP